MPIIASDRLHALTRAMVAAAGSLEREAALVADQLVEANLTGHDSHGVGILPFYLDRRQAGVLVANCHAEVVRDQGAVLVVDGHRGYGQVIGHEAMELAMARARTQGAAVLAIRNSFHLGRIGHWAEQSARGGLVSIHFVNDVDHPPTVAPHGATEARLSTNPFCASVPGEDGPAVLLDMATSKIAFGKVKVALNKGVETPEGCMLEPAGTPTRDPAVMFADPRGMLLPMGEHKGSGLAIMCELLAGALTGGPTMHPDHPRQGGSVNNMLAVLIDPDALGGGARFGQEVGALVDYVKAARPRPDVEEVLVPGEPEHRRRARHLAQGIELDECTVAELTTAAATVGIGGGEVDAVLG